MHKVRSANQKTSQVSATTEEKASRSRGPDGQTEIEKPTREEVAQLVGKVAKKVTQSPAKAATILSGWMQKPAKRAKKRAA